MAYKQHIPALWLKAAPATANIGHFYNVDLAVGLNCPNKREDVMLVQLMMRVLADNRARSASVACWDSPPVRIDGIGDQLMIARIYTYQLGNSASLTINGRVDPAKSTESPIGQGKLTIMHLNLNLMDFPTVFADLSAVKAIPSDLAKAIKNFRT